MKEKESKGVKRDEREKGVKRGSKKKKKKMELGPKAVR